MAANCQPFALASVYAALSLIADAEYLYWSGLGDPNPGGGDVVKLPKKGGTIKSIAALSKIAPTLAASGPNVYAFYSGDILKIAKTGDKVEKLGSVPGWPFSDPTSGGVGRIGADSTSVYFGGWAACGSKLHRLPVAGGPVSDLWCESWTCPCQAQQCPLYGRSGPLNVAAVTDQVVAFRGPSADCNGSPQSDGRFLRVPVAGGSSATLATGLGPTQFAVDSTNVYYIVAGSGQSELSRIPLNGGKKTIIWSGGNACSGALAIDTSRVYCSRRDGNNTFSIWSVPKAGGSATQVASQGPAPNGIFSSLVVDDSSLYWFAPPVPPETSGRIMKLAKP